MAPGTPHPTPHPTSARTHAHRTFKQAPSLHVPHPVAQQRLVVKRRLAARGVYDASMDGGLADAAVPLVDAAGAPVDRAVGGGAAFGAHHSGPDALVVDNGERIVDPVTVKLKPLQWHVCPCHVRPWVCRAWFGSQQGRAGGRRQQQFASRDGAVGGMLLLLPQF